MEKFWEFFDVYSFEESVVIVFEFLLAFLYEALISAAEELPGGEDGKLIFILALFAVDV